MSVSRASDLAGQIKPGDWIFFSHDVDKYYGVYKYYKVLWAYPDDYSGFLYNVLGPDDSLYLYNPRSSFFGQKPIPLESRVTIATEDDLFKRFPALLKEMEEGAFERMVKYASKLTTELVYDMNEKNEIITALELNRRIAAIQLL